MMKEYHYIISADCNIYHGHPVPATPLNFYARKKTEHLSVKLIVKNV